MGLGGFLIYALNHLNGKAGLAGWSWMFLIQGLIAIGELPMLSALYGV